MGWYYDMIRYDGRIDVKNLKAVGPGMVTGGVYYNSVYSPDFQYGNAGQCEARTVGATERQMYCMPWGVCPTDAPNKPSKNGTLGYASASKSLQRFPTPQRRTKPRTCVHSLASKQYKKELKWQTKPRPPLMVLAVQMVALWIQQVRLITVSVLTDSPNLRLTESNTISK